MIGLRRLPIPLAPAHHETLASWLHRLATVHGLSSADLHHHLRIRPRVDDDADELRALARRVAAMIGHPAGALALHNHPDDPVLTDRQWEHVATEIAAAVGLAPHGDPDAARWIGIRHAAGHVHIVATLARQDRRAEWLWQDYRRAQACCREQEQRYRLHRVGGRATAERYPTPAELNKTTRQQRDQVPRDQLRRTVRTAAAGADGEQGFLDRLRAYGVLVRPRTSTTNPNQLTGYAVALPDDHNAAGDTIWYSGSTLAADLSLPNLRHRWPSP